MSRLLVTLVTTATVGLLSSSFVHAQMMVSGSSSSGSSGGFGAGVVRGVGVVEVEVADQVRVDVAV